MMIRSSLLALVLAAAACAAVDDGDATSGDVSTLDEGSIGEASYEVSPTRHECWYTTSPCSPTTCIFECYTEYCDGGGCHGFYSLGCYACEQSPPPRDPPPRGPHET